MRAARLRLAGVLSIGIAGVVLATASPALAGTRCGEPSSTWQRATPAAAGMDAAKLRDAIDYGTTQLSFAVRVYRHGCLVGEDRLAGSNRTAQYESWSLAKSVTSMVFGRAMTLGLISPDDPVGALIPEADAAHGAITMRDLLTMSSGLRWNGLRDYNVFTMPDRIRDALSLDVVHKPGTYYEYAQSAVSLLAEAVGRAAGEDFVAFAQRELMGPLGIQPGAWKWIRDRAGHAAGFMGVNMRPDDFGRLGDLMRRDGTWRGRRLLSRRYMHDALSPSAVNRCYGWLIWLNSGAPCVGPRIAGRPVDPKRRFPDLPRDHYTFSGLFGQIVAVLPSQDIVVVRTGQDPGVVNPTGGTGWEHELYRRVLRAITDTPFKPAPAEAAARISDEPNPDGGFHTALAEPDQFSQGVVQAPLPAAGPHRARALRVRLAKPLRAGARHLLLRATCPARWPGRSDATTCVGIAQLERGGRAIHYRLAAGQTRLLRLPMRRRLSRRQAALTPLAVVATNSDAAAGTQTKLSVG